MIWDASSATIDQAFDDPAGLSLRTPALSPDGATVFGIDVDGNIVAWDLRGDRRLGRTFTAGAGATWPGFDWPWFAISPDGNTLAIVQSTSKARGSVRLVDSLNLRTIGVIPFNRSESGYPEGLAFSPDNRSLAVTSWDGYVQLWDVRTRRPQGPPLRAAGGDRIDFWFAAFSPDGSTLAAAGSDWASPNPGNVFLWNVATGQLIGRLPKQADPVSAVSFSPEGTRLVASTGYGAGPGDAIVWNVASGSVERMIPADETGVSSQDLSKDGATLVTGGESGRERLWDVSTGQPIGPAFTGPARTVDLSPDGRTLVGADKGRVIMWDVATQMVLGRSFPGPGPADVLAAAFTPDGRRLFIVSATGDAWVWDVGPDSWEGRACQIAGRSMTQAEWQLYLPDRPYRDTCGDDGSS